MKSTKLLFSLCIILLLALFANGVYFLMLPRGIRLGSGPVPLAYSGEDRPFAGEGFSDHGSGGAAGDDLRRWVDATGTGYPVNLLVLGLDGEGTRSDVILLFNFQPGQEKLNVLSIARDTLVTSNGKYCKINALYSKGGELLLARKVSQITGLPVHYYITVDFRGFRKIVDTLGGVWFDVPFAMSYDDPAQRLHIRLKKGMQLLDGKKAEQLVRYRKGNLKGQGYTEGDLGRIRMQQEFVKALIGQKLNLWYISKADSIFEILQSYVKTNISIADILQYSGDIMKIGHDGVNAAVAPGTSKMIDGAWYFIIDTEETQKIINGSFYR